MQFLLKKVFVWALGNVYSIKKCFTYIMESNQVRDCELLLLMVGIYIVGSVISYQQNGKHVVRLKTKRS